MATLPATLGDSELGGVDIGIPTTTRMTTTEKYGIDVSCNGTLDPTFAPLTGTDAVAECIARMLQTPRGALWAHPDRGTDLRMYLNEAIDANVLSRIESEVIAECVADERVESARVQVEHSLLTNTLTLGISLQLADGPFRLVLGISSVSVSILYAQ